MEDGSLGDMIEPAVSLWFMLLRQETVQQDLQLTDRQKATIGKTGATCAVKMREAVRSLLDAHQLPVEERHARLAAVREQLAAQAEQVAKTLGRVLAPRQTEQLQQLVQQLRAAQSRDERYDRWPSPKATVANHWIDAADNRVRQDPVDLSKWWTVFQDPVLDRLIAVACLRNPSLQYARDQVLQARAQMVGPATKAESAPPDPNDPVPVFAIDLSAPGDRGLDFAWELDFWSRFPLAAGSAEDRLDAAVEDDGELRVALLADVAGSYLRVRVLQERLRALQECMELQRSFLALAEEHFRMGHASALDSIEGRSHLAESQAQLPRLQIELRQAANRLCVLLGKPPMDVTKSLGTGPLPALSAEVTIGIPADLLRRRPDVRRAERRLSARADAIGIGGAELVTYQNAVLRAGEEVENGLVTFLRAEERSRCLAAGVNDARQAVELARHQYMAGVMDFRRSVLLMQKLVYHQDALAEARGQVAQGLIQICRALGGGWQTRLTPAAPITMITAVEEACEEPPVPAPALPPPPPAPPQPLPPLLPPSPDPAEKPPLPRGTLDLPPVPPDLDQFSPPPPPPPPP